MHRTLLAALLAAGLTAPAAGGASAAEAPVRLGIRPVGHAGSFFDLTLRPGERRRLQVELGNFGPQPVEARTYAADVYTIVNGGLGAELHDQPVSGVTRWLDYEPQRLELPAGRGVVREFGVEVPDGVGPGEYITGLVIENAEPIAGSGSLAINQINRVVIAVAISVPGPRRPALAIEEADHRLVNGTSVVTFSVANAGNVHLRPRAQFSLYDVDGTPVSSAETQMDTFFAGTGAILEFPLTEQLGPGEYCGALALDDAAEGARAAADCLPLHVEPAPAPPGDDGSNGGPELPGGRILPEPAVWLPVATVLLLAVVVVVGALLRLRRRREW